MIQQDHEASSGNNPEFYAAENHHRKRRMIALYLITAGVAAIISYEAWVEITESPTKFDH